MERSLEWVLLIVLMLNEIQMGAGHMLAQEWTFLWYRRSRKLAGCISTLYLGIGYVILFRSHFVP